MFMRHLYYKVGTALAMFSLPLVSSAQLDQAKVELGKVGQVVGEGEPLPTLIGNFINVILGILGILLVVYFVYAGFLYMTAQGESKKVDSAKGIMKDAVIGLVIIVFAYAIAGFVIDTLIKTQ
jgi:hypothetical protein